MDRRRGLLIVDGDVRSRSALASAFRRQDFDVLVAHDDHHAVHMLETGQPDYIVIDLKPPAVGDLRLVSRIKALNPRCRVVILTSYGSIATAVEAIKLGATYYLTKPAHPEEVIAAFHRDDGDESVPITSIPLSVNRVEWEHINRVLLENDGNISATARALGMHRRTLQRKLGKRMVER